MYLTLGLGCYEDGTLLTLPRNELEAYLQLFEYSFDSNAMKKFLDFFDKDGSGL
jgi:hypothetical protein